VARMVWAKVGAKIEEALDSISFEDLLLRQHMKKTSVPPKLKKRTALAGKGVC
jgi:hypothetical protein